MILVQLIALVTSHVSYGHRTHAIWTGATQTDAVRTVATLGHLPSKDIYLRTDAPGHMGFGQLSAYNSSHPRTIVICYPRTFTSRTFAIILEKNIKHFMKIKLDWDATDHLGFKKVLEGTRSG